MWGAYRCAVAEDSLRERKKARTRRALQEAALRLFAERGYDATTTDDIAQAADVSPRTFFRYFATKEEVVEWDDYDPIIEELLAARPPDEPPLTALRAVLLDLVDQMTPEAERQVLNRVHLMLTVPALRARVLDAQLDWVDRAVPILARRTGRVPDDLALHVAAITASSWLIALYHAWLRSDGTARLADLVASLDRALATDPVLDFAALRSAAGSP